MAVVGGEHTMTPFGSYRSQGQLAVSDRPRDRDGRWHLSIMASSSGRVADCWLTRDELRALRDRLTALLERRG